MPLVKVAQVADLKPGECKTVVANGRDIALANVGGNFHAIDNTCIHRGGPLGEGTLAGAEVTCPWHGWKFDVNTGVCKVNPARKVDSFRVEVQGDDVMVEI